jgi:hypothetical protein
MSKDLPDTFQYVREQLHRLRAEMWMYRENPAVQELDALLSIAEGEAAKLHRREMNRMKTVQVLISKADGPVDRRAVDQ